MIKKANIQWSGKQLTKSIEKGTINFDNAVQRGYIWDLPRKSLLIHSMIEGFPYQHFLPQKMKMIIVCWTENKDQMLLVNTSQINMN